MRLSSLITSNEGISHYGSDPEITGVTADSRDVQPGYLFIAVAGSAYDGRDFIDDARRKGAAAVLAPDPTPVPDDFPFVLSKDLRRTVSAVAARYYPDQPEVIAAVTGTSGKTSTAQFAREMWQALGHTSASIGTLGLVTRDATRYGSLTTPDALTLHRLLEECSAMGISHLAMEASSHGLALHRLDGVRLAVAAFTNLSRDHLDFHGNQENYLAAKTRLFSEVLDANGTAVLPTDAPQFPALREVALRRGQRVIEFGRNAEDIRLIEVTPDGGGQKIEIDLYGTRRHLYLPLMGGFQAWNALCALGMVIGSGADAAKACAAFSAISGVPGRLQKVGATAKGSVIFVDYAHKPDALENVLKAVRPHLEPHPGAKLSVVFGCGGNRDSGKRPLMGEIACRLADHVIVTDDNPRQEDADKIRREVIAGCRAPDKVREIGDRGQAIAAAIEGLGAHDILIVAGKGHETGQIIGDITVPFDDAAIVRTVLGLPL